MKNGIEKRCAPRISAYRPVVLMTPKGAIKGKSDNVKSAD